MTNFLSNELDPSFRRRAAIIFENLEMSGSESVLDIGCGRGFYTHALVYLFPKARVVGIDSNVKYIALAQKQTPSPRVQFLVVNAKTLPFANNSFDRVICSEVLEHIPDDMACLEEVFRVLKKDGVAMISVPNCNYPFNLDPLNWGMEHLFKVHIPSQWWWLAGIWADHVRLYSPQELQEKTRLAGLKISRTWFATRYLWPFSHFVLYALGKNLVELGLFPSLNRFSYTSRPSFLNRLALKFINIIDTRNNRLVLTDQDPFVNIIMQVRK